MSAGGDINELIPALIEKLHRERFTGELVLKVEAGRVTLVRQRQDLDRDGLEELMT